MNTMSAWSYITGTVTLNLMGLSTAHNEYMLKEVLSHLPDVNPTKWSEHHFDLFINKPMFCSSSSSHDDFMISAHYPDYNIENMNRFSTPNYAYHDKWIERNDTFIITINGIFRDCYFEECLKSFNKWLNRLAKRLWVTDVVVRVSGYSNSNKEFKQTFISSDTSFYSDMYEGDYTNYLYPKMNEYGFIDRESIDSNTSSGISRRSSKKNDSE